MLTRYPVDGIELQLNFWPDDFHPKEVKAVRKIIGVAAPQKRVKRINRFHAALRN